MDKMVDLVGFEPDDEGDGAVWAVMAPGLTDMDGVLDGFIHVVPFADLHPHILSVSRCWCHPELDDEEGVVTHNSADGREGYETGARKLN